MGSLNAFANGHLDDPLDELPPAKRVRLSEDAIASIHHQLADAETSLEVDHMILDYVAYHTIEACLASRGQDTQTNFTGLLPSTLSMFDSFLEIFESKHPDFRPDAELRFRKLLLKTVAVYTQRLTSNPATPPIDELRHLRSMNTKRASLWTEPQRDSLLSKSNLEAFTEDLPISDENLDRNRAHVLQQLDIPAEDELYEDGHYGMPSCVCLLDLIPTFMQLTAAQCAMGYSNLTERWMELAVEMMVQACLEQYLVYGASGTEALMEAFAWGYRGSDENLDAKDRAVDEMFEDEDYEKEVDGWKAMKMEYLRLFLSGSESSNSSNGNRDTAPSGPIAAHLEAVAERFPIERFERSMLAFLSGLSRSISEPVLVQLERGYLDGMTKEQTDDFLLSCGLDVATFFRGEVGFKELSC